MNPLVEPPGRPRRNRPGNIGEALPATRREKVRISPADKAGDALRIGQDPSECESPVLDVGDDHGCGPSRQQGFESGDPEPKRLLGRFAERTEGRQELCHHRPGDRRGEIPGQRERTRDELQLAEICKFGLGSMKERYVDMRQHLSRTGQRRLAPPRAPQDAALDAVCAGEDGENQVPVAIRVVVENQCVVVDGGHRLMVAELAGA